MQKILLSLICLSFPILQFGQTNLVPNPGFEDSISCTNSLGAYRPNNWFTPNMGTPDYYLTTQTNNTGCFDDAPDIWGGNVFNGDQGYQLPRSGKGYSGFGVMNGSENMAVKLTDSLKAGRRYSVSGYTSLASSSRSAIDLIQFGFTKSNIASYDTSTGGPTWICDSVHEYCGGQPYSFITDTSNWILITDTLFAQGGERYFIVGNFDTADTHYMSVDTANPSRFSYYYFDDFDVHCIDCNTGISSPPVFGDISLTPNPGDGNFQLKGNFPAGTKLQIFDMLGQKISEMEIAQGNQTVVLSLTLAEAVYLYHLDAGGQQLKTGKLVIQR